MSEPTIVMSRTKTIESWSSWKAMSAEKSPTWIQVKSSCPYVRPSAGCCIISRSMSTPMTADPSTVSTPR